MRARFGAATQLIALPTDITEPLLIRIRIVWRTNQGEQVFAGRDINPGPNAARVYDLVMARTGN